MSSAKLNKRNRNRLMRTAVEVYCSTDEVEILPGAEITRASDRGFWIAARVYVPVESVEPLKGWSLRVGG